MAAKQRVESLMTKNPIILSAEDNIVEAAKRMQKENVGDVLVRDGDDLCGIVTDRDIVLRGVALEKNPSDVMLKDVCSKDPQTISADEDIEKAIDMMRQHAVRRLPVTRNGSLVGILSLGDLAVARDPNSVLGEISASAAKN